MAEGIEKPEGTIADVTNGQTCAAPPGSEHGMYQQQGSERGRSSAFFSRGKSRQPSVTSENAETMRMLGHFHADMHPTVAAFEEDLGQRRRAGVLGDPAEQVA